MTRDQFVKVAITALRQTPGRSPEEQAEAIASLMDTVASILGDAPAPPQRQANPSVESPRPAFPAPNPEAIYPVAQQANPSMVIPATRIPDAEEMAKMKAAAPAASLRSVRPAEKMSVPDLNLYIQANTPQSLPVDIPVEGGGTRRITFERDVYSLLALDSVRLVYFPPGTSQVAREASEVQYVVHVDDMPIDIQAILRQMVAMAVDSLRPRKRIVAVDPGVASGPVTTNKTYEGGGNSQVDPTSSQQIQGAFSSLG